MTSKYIREPPFNLEFNALYNELIQKILTLASNTKATATWKVQYPLNNENTSDQEVRNTVIDLSIKKRVFRAQTVFSLSRARLPVHKLKYWQRWRCRCTNNYARC